MKDEKKTKKQLLNELVDLHRRVKKLEASEAKHKHIKKELQFRSDFENLISNISTHFINLPTDEIDNGINQALKSIGEFAEVDRSYVFQHCEDETKADNTHEWNAAGIIPQIQRLEAIPIEHFQWLVDKLSNDEVVYIRRLLDLPPEAEAIKRELELEGIKSIIMVPMIAAEKVEGFIGFDSVQKEKEWPPDIISLLKMIGEIFANALERKRSEDALKESEGLYRTLFNSTVEGIAILENGNIVDANKSMGDLFGCEPSELIGKSAWDLAGPESREDVLRHIRENSEEMYEAVGVRKDGTKIIGELAGRTLNYKGRRLRLVTQRNITDRKLIEKALRESEEQLRLLIDNAPLHISEVDISLTFRIWNKYAEKMLGYTAEEALGKLTVGDLIKSKEDLAVIRRMLSETGVCDREINYKRKDGTFVPVRLVTVLRKGPDGQEIGTYGFAEDIAERRRAEEQVREHQLMLKAIVESSKDWIWAINTQSKHTYSNPAIKTILGYTPEEFQGMGLDLLHPDDLQVIESHWNEWLEEKKGWSNLVLRWRTRDGGYRYLESNAVPIIGNKGEILGFRGVDRDITDHKLVDKALIESEKRFRSLVETTSDWVWEVNKDGVYTYTSPKVKDLLGYEPEEVTGKTPFDFMPADEAARLKNMLNNAMKLQKSIRNWENINLRKDGKAIMLETSGVPIINDDGELIGYRGIDRDITERKQAEDALRESEELYRTLVETSPDAITLTDMLGNILMVNQRAAELYGHDNIEEILGMNSFKYIHPDELQRAMSEMPQTVKTGSARNVEYKLVKKDGAFFIGEVSASLLLDTEGKPKGFMAVTRDITKRKQAAAAIKESEALYRSLVETSPDAIGLTDFEGKILMLNNQSASLLGFDGVEQAIGKDSLQLMPPEFRQFARENMAKIIEKGTLRNIEYVFNREDGTKILTEMNVSLVSDAEGKPKALLGVMRDITEKKKIEEFIFKAEKLDSIGVLAGGLAHDFNNILTAILGNISLARLYANPEDRIIKSLTEAEKSCLRARDLTQQLLTFSKGGSPIRKAASISELLKETADFTASGSSTRCEYRISGDLWAVEVDEGQISQVINNLILNAIQAMPQGGNIKISAQNIVIGEDAGLPLMEGNYIKISIEDQGIGIHEEYLPKIFDPYFTTKQKGSGLGLAIAYSIIRKHDGHITVESTPGVGTTFYVYLPASQTKLEIKKETTEILKGHGKILLMDDEEIVRKAAGNMLLYLGYEVEVAGDGVEMI